MCAGSVVLGRTGVLDGMHATSHWSRITALRHSRPAVRWVTGRRWVEEGSVITTAAVTSGVPAALHLVAAGTTEAQRVARLHPELDWSPHQSTGIARDPFTADDVLVGLNFVEPWFRPTVGIALDDGVDELDATAAFELYTQSAVAHTVALATKGTVRTRHGLLLHATSTADAPSLSRVLVPGADGLDPQLRRWAVKRHVVVEPLEDRPSPTSDRRSGGGFTTALQNLSDHTDAATALSTAKMIGYPTKDREPNHGHRPLRAALLVLASVVIAVLAGTAPFSMVRRRRRRSATSFSSASHMQLAGPRWSDEVAIARRGGVRRSLNFPP